MTRRYGLPAYLAGATTARTADEMSSPALLLLGLAVTGSARSASLLYAGLTISAAAGGPVLGALLDRSRRPGRILGATLAGYAAGLAVITVALGAVPVAVVVGVAVLAGFLAPSLTGGWTSRLADVADRGRITRAYSLDAATFSAASLAGPALAGLIAATSSPAWAMTVVTALLLLATPLAWRLPSRPAGDGAAGDGAAGDRAAGDRAAGDRAEPRPGGGEQDGERQRGHRSRHDNSLADEPTADQPPGGQPAAGDATADQPADGEPTASDPAADQPAGREPTADQPGGSDPGGSDPAAHAAGDGQAAGAASARPGLVADVRAGLAAIAGSRSLLRITVCSVVAYLGVGLLVVACPLLGQRYLGGADRGALLLSVLAAASLAATAVMSRWPPPVAPDVTFAAVTALAGAACAALALAASPAWIIAAIALAGVADGPQLAAVFAVRHREAPPRLRGQVFTTAASLKITAGAIGAALAGLLAAHSVTLVLAAAALTQAAALAAFLALRPRYLPRPPPAPAPAPGPAPAPAPGPRR